MNGCGMCMDSHERVLLQHGVKPETIQSAVRIARGDEGRRDGPRNALAE